MGRVCNVLPIEAAVERIPDNVVGEGICSRPRQNGGQGEET